MTPGSNSDVSKVNAEPSIVARERPGVGFSRRLVAEAIRLREDARNGPFDEARADEAARASGGDFEQRIVIRAQALSIAPAIEAALRHLASGTSLAVVFGLAAAFLAGAGSARVVLGSYAGAPVNFPLAVASLLGAHLVLLAAWLLVVLIRPGGAHFGVLGTMMLALGRRITGWLHKGPLEVAAVQAAGGVVAGSSIGRWLLSSISNAIWLAFLTSCFAFVVLLLSTRQYDFAWETTILSKTAFLSLTRLIAAPVAAFGFPVPDDGQIIASRWTGQGEPFTAAARDAWGGLFMGCIVVYGLLPRGLALTLSLVALLRARARFRLDTTHVGFARLRNRLMPIARSTGIVDPDTIDAANLPSPEPEAGVVPIQREGPTALLGIEIEAPGTGWPPSLPGADWWDLGFVDNRLDREKTLEQLSQPAQPPRALVVACSLTATPDRGTAAFIDMVRRTCGCAVVLLLSDGQRLRQRARPSDVDQRIEDWHRLATQAHVAAGHILHLDLDHITDASRARLARLLGCEPLPTPADGCLRRAFSLIAEHAAGWSVAPDVTEQAELHREIARLYDDSAPSWRKLLNIPVGRSIEPLRHLRHSAERMTELLPARLRLSAGWLAAGAVAGALGCVAASTLVAPAAIAALPAWAGLGAAVSGLLASLRSGSQTKRSPSSVDLGEAVAAAALFALVLDQQGRNEDAIARILDRTLGTDDPPVLPDPPAVRAWLTLLNERLDAALVEDRQT
jgi:Protein of unknown function (DUF2868)